MYSLQGEKSEMVKKITLRMYLFRLFEGQNRRIV